MAKRVGEMPPIDPSNPNHQVTAYLGPEGKTLVESMAADNLIEVTDVIRGALGLLKEFRELGATNYVYIPSQDPSATERTRLYLGFDVSLGTTSLEEYREKYQRAD